MHSIERKIRFADVDAAGILYYPRFFEFCHNAFEDCFDQRGPFVYSALIREHRLGFPTVHAQANFVAPLQHGDVAIIRLHATHIGKSAVTIHYAMLRKRDDKMCFEGDITTVCMNLDTHKSMALPKPIRDFFAELKS